MLPPIVSEVIGLSFGLAKEPKYGDIAQIQCKKERENFGMSYLSAKPQQPRPNFFNVVIDASTNQYPANVMREMSLWKMMFSV
jgi:hypothetical protein